MTPSTNLGAGLTLTSIVVGPLRNNVYLLRNGNGEAVLVDAADEAPQVLDLVGDTRVTTLLTTHQHHDHVAALAEVARATGARTVCGRPDQAAIARATGVSCEPMWTGDTLRLGDQELAVIGLVGHTPGSIALAVHPVDGPAHIFTGDSLFPGGVGKTGSSEAFTTLLDDVTRELFDAFDDDTTVWPGHGDPTTLGDERPHLDEWRQRGW